jgi:hypothetical protein
MASRGMDWKCGESGAAMLKRKRLGMCILVPLYLITWVGGWISHARQLRRHTESGYRALESRREEFAGFNRELSSFIVSSLGRVSFQPNPWLLGPTAKVLILAGNCGVPDRRLVHADGPKSGVFWCVPILPGLLLADSYYSIGPLAAAGGSKLVIYWGFGSTEIPFLWYWIA